MSEEDKEFDKILKTNNISVLKIQLYTISRIIRESGE